MSAPDFAHSRQAERRRQEKARTLARWSCVRSPPGPDKTKVVYCRKTDGTIPLGLPRSRSWAIPFMARPQSDDGSPCIGRAAVGFCW